MKSTNKILILGIIISIFFTGCEFFEDFKEDNPYNFFIDYNENLTQVFADRDNTIEINIKSDKGIARVEMRENFEIVTGSQQTYSGEGSILYHFDIIPPKSRIGEAIEYTIVAIDTDGFAVSRDLTLTVNKAPSLVKVLLPPNLPSEINYNDTLSFDVPFTSTTELSKILIMLEDEVLLKKESDFASSNSDIIEFYYDGFDVLAPGENKNFIFDFIGIAPINETLFDTVKVSYDVFVKGPREPLPLSDAKNYQLGFQANASVPQFIDVDTGDLFFYLSAPFGSENSEKVDFGFYRSGSNGMCLANPTDGDASSFIYNNSSHGFNAWTTRNKTEFVKVINPELLDEDKFDAATTDELFYEVYDSAPVIANTFKKLVEGDIVVFKTIDGKFGAILFTSYVNSGSGTVDFKLKMQK